MPAQEVQAPVSHSKMSADRRRSPDAKESILSPGFRSAVAMAGWDEEALLACLVVEDTPVRDVTKSKKRSVFPLKTPPTDSRRKKRSQKRSPTYVPAVVLSLDDDETAKELGRVDEEKKREEVSVAVKRDKEPYRKAEEAESNPNKVLPCMDKLREELSCAICLEICFEPSTTPCGHSFCKKCLKCAALRCGKKCPKCREMISHGRACTVNTVLWNTIQLLFPEEVEARRKAAAAPPSPRNRKSSEKHRNSSEESNSSTRTRRSSSSSSWSSNMSFIMSSELVGTVDLLRRRMREGVAAQERTARRGGAAAGATPSQSEDAALALRLQREEFLRGRREELSSNQAAVAAAATQRRVSAVHSARASLRAMASRAVQTRSGGRFS